MSVDFDVAVIGLGAMGSMSLWRLAERGVSVVGFDRFDPPHDRGSSHGESRVIRTAYAEGEFYVPLLREAFTLWRELQQHSATELLTVTGALMIGPANGQVVAGTLSSARRHQLRHELLTGGEAARRFPQHVINGGDAIVWDGDAGVLRPEMCIATALRVAADRGATVNRNARVAFVHADHAGVTLRLDGDAELRADRCVVAAGPWTAGLLPALGQRLHVERQVLAWFAVADPAVFAPDRFPVFLRELEGGRLRYGLPTLDGATIKLAVHHEGARADPESIDRQVSPSDLAPLQEFVATRLRGVSTECPRATVCMYTNTPDEHLLLGFLPDQPRIIVVGGCSGHSFKFASVFGDIVADLASTGRTLRDIEAFRLDR